MKKITVSFATLLALFTLTAAFSVSVQSASAQVTTSCPAGYVCRPIEPQVNNCPVGFTCTPVSIGNTMGNAVSNDNSVSGNGMSCSQYVPSTNVSVGSRGSDVSSLQSFLISKGFDIHAISSGATSKGYFGNQTAVALKQYQQSVGLPQSGKLDATTIANIKSVVTAGCSNPTNANNLPSQVPPVATNQIQILNNPITATPSIVSTQNLQTSPYQNYGQLRISSISGPSTVQQGQSAIWTINSNATSLNSSSIMYSVDWGNGEAMVTQASNTFTHSYPNAGSYGAQFEVYDSSTGGAGYSIVTGYIKAAGTNSSAIHIISPQSGQTYNVGNTLNIRWSGAMKLISIKNLGTNTSRNVVLSPLTSAGDTSGSYNYVIPSDILSGFRTGTFSVSVYNSYGTSPEIFDTSGPFTIQASATACSSGQIWSNGACTTAPSISISQISPTSALVGAQTTISGVGFQQYDQACFSNSSGVISSCVTPSSLSSSQISLTVPSITSGTYTVKVRRGDFLESNGLSFTVNSLATACPSGQIWNGSMCQVTSTSQYFTKILSPNGGEQYTQGQTVPISFSTNLTSQQAPNGFNIILYYGADSTNAGMFSSGVQTVAFRYTGGSPYNWSIPSTLATGNYVAYIVPDQLTSGIPSTGLFDFGDNYFTINAPSVTPQPTLSITAPTGGSYQAGGALNIQWTATGLTQNNNSLGLAVYETSLGSTHSLLSTTVANPVSNGQVSSSGSYNWTIPTSAHAGSDYVVYLSSSSGWKQSSPFTINSAVVANAAANDMAVTYGTKVTNPNTTVQQFTFEFGITAGNDPIYLSKTASTALSNTSTLSGITITDVDFSDTNQNGDTASFFYVAPGQTKNFNAIYSASGSNSSTGVYSVNSINYGLSSSNLASNSLTSSDIANSLKVVLFH